MAEDGASSNTSSVAFQEQNFQEISKKRITTIPFQIKLAHVHQTYPLQSKLEAGKAAEICKNPCLKAHL